MAMQLKSDFVMVINCRKGPVGTHIPFQAEFPASVPYRLAIASDTFSSLMTRISGLARQYPYRVQMQRDSSLYLYVESFKKSHTNPNDHYIELTAENYQAALTQDWLRQYQQCLGMPEFSSDKTDHFIKVQLFMFIEDEVPPVMNPITTHIQPLIKNTAPQVPVRPAKASAPTRSTRTPAMRAPPAQHTLSSFGSTNASPTLQEADALLDRAIVQSMIPVLGLRARSYVLSQVMLQPSMSMTDLSVLAGSPRVQSLISYDELVAAMESRMHEQLGKLAELQQRKYQ